MAYHVLHHVCSDYCYAARQGAPGSRQQPTASSDSSDCCLLSVSQRSPKFMLEAVELELKLNEDGEDAAASALLVPVLALAAVVDGAASAGRRDQAAAAA